MMILIIIIIIIIIIIPWDERYPFPGCDSCQIFLNFYVKFNILTLHGIRRTTITRLILNSVRLTHKNTTCCHSTKVNITKYFTECFKL